MFNSIGENKIKERFLLIVLSFVLIIVLSCNSKSNQKINDFDVTLGFTHGFSEAYNNVHYIRTNWSSPSIFSPIVTVISSRHEVKNYFEPVSDFCCCVNIVDTLMRYSDDYFTNNFIVIVKLDENSGSIKHNVEKIDEYGKIFINRIIPEIGTDDMARWNILIELNNIYLSKQFQVIF